MKFNKWSITGWGIIILSSYSLYICFKLLTMMLELLTELLNKVLEKGMGDEFNLLLIMCTGYILIQAFGYFTTVIFNAMKLCKSKGDKK